MGGYHILCIYMYKHTLRSILLRNMLYLHVFALVTLLLLYGLSLKNTKSRLLHVSPVGERVDQMAHAPSIIRRLRKSACAASKTERKSA